MLLFIGRGLHGDCLVFEFQNILCYCLSVAKSVHEPPFLKFQNILCYCLSYIRFIQKELIYISKHLMLLFIFKASCNSQHFSAFQNILCYCLSKSHLDRYVTDYISKHLMLLFIFIFFPAATLPSSIYLELTDEVEKQLFDYIQEIEALIAEEKPPECIHKNTCKKCAYYEYCYI